MRWMLAQSPSENTALFHASSAGPCSGASPGYASAPVPCCRRSRHSANSEAPASSAFCSSSRATEFSGYAASTSRMRTHRSTRWPNSSPRYAAAADGASPVAAAIAGVGGRRGGGR